jgi:hypothetical protein
VPEARPAGAPINGAPPAVASPAPAAAADAAGTPGPNVVAPPLPPNTPSE